MAERLQLRFTYVNPLSEVNCLKDFKGTVISYPRIIHSAKI
jgi:hypothetical protein